MHRRAEQGLFVHGHAFLVQLILVRLAADAHKRVREGGGILDIHRRTDRPDRPRDRDFIAQVLGAVQHVLQGATGGDGIEAGGTVDLYGGGVHPDAKGLFLAPHRDRGRRAGHGYHDLKLGAFGDRGLAFDGPEDDDLGPVEIGGDRDFALVQAQHNRLVRDGGERQAGQRCYQKGTQTVHDVNPTE